MASSDFTVEGLSLPQVIEVDWGDTVDCALVSVSGVETISWTIISKSRSTLSTPTLTSAGSPSGATMSFPMPAADAAADAGGSYLLDCTVTYGVGQSHSTRAVIGVPAWSGEIPCAAGETTERGDYGWLDRLNDNTTVRRNGGTATGVPALVADDATPDWVTIYTIATGLAANQRVRIGVGVDCWQDDDRTTNGYLQGEITVRYTGSALAVVDQIVPGGTAASGIQCQFTTSGTNVLVQAMEHDTNDWRYDVDVWMRPIKDEVVT